VTEHAPGSRDVAEQIESVLIALLVSIVPVFTLTGFGLLVFRWITS
jgi:hypothetical protein